MWDATAVRTADGAVFVVAMLGLALPGAPAIAVLARYRTGRFLPRGRRSGP